MSELVKDTRAGDHLFLHCKSYIARQVHQLTVAPVSGHGSQVTDQDDDEVDGMDEGITSIFASSGKGRA